MKLYVYCLVEALDELPRPLHGISGAEVRLLSWDNLSLLVSDFAGEVVPVSRENAMAHAAVVQNILASTTPLPFRFGTLVTEEQLRSYVAAKREELAAKLKRVRGSVEMSVKMIWDREWTPEPATNTGHEKPGTAFLSEKRREILGGEARADEAERVAEWLEGQVYEVVTETYLTKNPTEKLLLASAHLVKRDDLPRYRTLIKDARQQRPELHFLVSGPWAPYSFANIDLEFNRHFGVS